MMLLLAILGLAAQQISTEAMQYRAGGSLVRLDAEAPIARDSDEEKDMALTLMHRWGLGSERQMMELAEPGTTAADVIRDAMLYSAVVVVVAGAQPPTRRNATGGQPFLAIEAPGEAARMTDSLERSVPVQAINAGAELLEDVLGRPLYPLRLVARTFGRDLFGSGGPMAVYDFSEGVIYLDRSVSRTLRMLPDAAAGALSDFAEGLFGGVASALGPGANEGSAADGIGGLSCTLARVGGAVLAAVLAAQVPVWFCVACPLVLGLLAPFLFNLGSGAVAQALCDRFQLPADECNDVWYGAFAVAMVLSLASAIPIVFVCRLPECARRPFPAFDSAFA